MQQRSTYSKIFLGLETHFSNFYSFYSIQRMTLLREPRQAAKHHSQVRPYPVISGVIVSDRTKTSGIRLTFTTITQKGKELRNQSANSVALEQQHSTKGQQQYLRSSPNDAPTAKKYVYTRKMV